MDFRKDYYKILELDKTANKEEIRAAYRKLAKLYHPDKNQGNTEAEEHFKLINEANEILGNEILRNEYDVYRKTEEDWKFRNTKTGDSVSSSNKRTYERTRTFTKEIRVYIRGKVQIKYWANQQGEMLASFDNETEYRITPAKVSVNILEKDIYVFQGISPDYLKAYKESDIFTSPIPNPVYCFVITPEGEEHYELELKEIRIKNIRLEGITKYEKQSFGTLLGDIYAYTPTFETYHETEIVSECFGATGRVESKTENDTYYFRKEYYNPDCSTYWSDWYGTVRKTSAGRKRPVTATPIVADGCLQWWWFPFLILFIILYPKLLLLFLLLFGIGLFFSLGTALSSLFSRSIPILSILLLIFIAISAIRSFSGSEVFSFQRNKPAYDSLSTTKTSIRDNRQEGDTATITDSIISHFIRWKSYDEKEFETVLSIRVSDANSSAVNHNLINPYSASGSLAPVYVEMLNSDSSMLRYVYASLDSIQKANNLDQLTFAQVIVSCLQSIPYYLVVDYGCTDYYEDEFTRNYLAECNRECCIGYEKFGVRSPAEFLTDLKGDCDTRSLFIYQVLKHYQYNVAMLTSQYYKHALIAVNFSSGNEPAGLAMNIHNKNYYLWETTNTGFNVGTVPSQLQNLDYWDITLLNENN